MDQCRSVRILGSEEQARCHTRDMEKQQHEYASNYIDEAIATIALVAALRKAEGGRVQWGNVPAALTPPGMAKKLHLRPTSCTILHERESFH